ncbi:MULTISPECIES: type II toxin-antitoxin system YafQ family toxin [unclassified Moraxella]|uniref:type II toxin-antitoxin system YafQ family toxin n=1 Tax=unclassified Moraxella TaxID=2685852 RepID=UPI003AF81032
MADRQVLLTNQFKRDIKKRYLDLVTPEWGEVFQCLTQRKPLPEKYCDHPLHGDKKGFRDCHVKPDLVLIYKINEQDIVEFHQLNTHSEIFG